MALLEKLDLAVDKDASDMCGRVGLGTSNIMSMACRVWKMLEKRWDFQIRMIDH